MNKKALFGTMLASATLVGATLLMAATNAVPLQTMPQPKGVVFDHTLPNAPGKSIKGIVVDYAPGAVSPAHMHAKSAFIYATVLEGSIRSQVNDGPVTVYNVGDNFYEMPGDRHSMSANASTTKPAKLLAVFIVDTDEKVLTTPIPK